jgi:chemotaxis protein MotA
MDLATIIGIALCFGGFLLGFILEGGQMASLVQITAALIVFGGTFGAGIASAPLAQTTGLMKIIMKAFMRPSYEAEPVIAKFVAFAEKVRREGLLVLEEDANQETDAFLKTGIQLVIDGNDTQLVKDILATELRYLEERHEHGAAYLEVLGGFAPTFGIIGTVMGLINVLANLSDPGSLGHSVSVAFVATLYGVVSANAVFLPLANKLKHASREEALMREVMIEGILSLQAGDNPRIVKEKLSAFLGPASRAKLATEGGGAE